MPLFRSATKLRAGRVRTTGRPQWRRTPLALSPVDDEAGEYVKEERIVFINFWCNYQIDILIVTRAM